MEELDSQIQRLLSEHILSFEQLEAVLLLRSSAPRAWRTQEVATALQVSGDAAHEALSALNARRLIAAATDDDELRYRFAPATAEIAQALERLADRYARHPVEILKLMSANAIERLRSSAARAFSEAFLLRGRRK